MQIYDQENTPFRFYDQGWNARVVGEPYRSDSHAAWRDGYNDCCGVSKDDQTFLLDPNRPREHLRPDGITTRADIRYDTRAERAIRNAMAVVEASGASTAMTDAVVLLSKAKDRVADHVEGIQ